MSTPDGALVASLRGLDRDGRTLFALRTLRLFAYGFLAVVLVLYLAAVGLDPIGIGLVLTLTLVGDVVLSLWLTTRADRLGRRRVLIAGSALMGVLYDMVLPVLIAFSVVAQLMAVVMLFLVSRRRQA